MNRIEYMEDDELRQVLMQRFGYAEDEVEVMEKEAIKKGKSLRDLVIESVAAIKGNAPTNTSAEEDALGWDEEDKATLTDEQKRQAELLKVRGEKEKQAREEYAKQKAAHASAMASRPQMTDEPDEEDEDEDEDEYDVDSNKVGKSKPKPKNAKKPKSPASVAKVDDEKEIKKQIASTGADLSVDDIKDVRAHLAMLLSDDSEETAPEKEEKKCTTEGAKKKGSKKPAPKKGKKKSE